MGQNAFACGKAVGQGDRTIAKGRLQKVLRNLYTVDWLNWIELMYAVSIHAAASAKGAVLFETLHQLRL